MSSQRHCPLGKSGTLRSSLVLAKLASLIQPQNTTKLLGQGPSLPRNAPALGAPHGLPLLPPSPLPRAAFQLEEASIQLSLHTNELATSSAATCGCAMKDSENLCMRSGWAPAALAFAHPLSPEWETQETQHPLGCTTQHPTCREVQVLLIWVPSAKGVFGGMG